MPKQPRTTRRRRGHALIVSGHGVRIHVSRGRLVVTDGIGEDRQERVYPRVGQNIGRVVMLAQDGSISLAAVRWLTGLGIPYLHLDRDGRLLAESAQARLDDPRLRRAQALAGTSPVGIAVARELITRKIRGQRSVLDHLGGDPTTVDPSLELALAASSLDEVRRAESTAALAYWASWSGLAVRFHRRDQDSVPAHWRRFVRRGSDITGNPRSATDPTNAILNYLYAILEAGRGESIQVSSGEGDRSRSARPLATNRGVDPMGTSTPKIVSPEEWEAARAALLVKEKEVTRARDALAASRRRMPMVAVEKTYRFDGPDGPATLLDLFDGRRQLVLYRFFMDPNMSTYPERGCKGCSLGADQLGNLAHLRARDTNYVAVSRAAQEHLQRYRERMGWTFPWYTTLDDFSEDFGVAEWHGTNVFLRDDDDRIYRTYFVGDRGDEHGDLWTFLDLTPYGRQEEWEDSPEGWPQTPPYQWWRYHDQYE